MAFHLRAWTKGYKLFNLRYEQVTKCFFYYPLGVVRLSKFSFMPQEIRFSGSEWRVRDGEFSGIRIGKRDRCVSTTNLTLSDLILSPGRHGEKLLSLFGYLMDLSVLRLHLGRMPGIWHEPIWYIDPRTSGLLWTGRELGVAKKIEFLEERAVDSH